MGRLAALWSRRSVQPFTLGKRRLRVDNGILSSDAVWNSQRNDASGNNWESGLIASMDKTRSGFA